MSKPRLNFDEFDATTQACMLDFLNYYNASAVEDDPDFYTGISSLRGYGVGQTVSRRIEDYRQRQGGVFWSLAPLEEVSYFGQDKLRDLAYTVGQLDAPKLALLTPQTSTGNLVDVFVDGPESLSMILQEIGQAHHYIHLSMMLFFNDEAGKLVAEALAQKAKAGVEVRVIVDGKSTGSGYYGSTAVDTSGEADFSEIADVLRAAGAMVVDSSDESYWEWEWDDKRKQLESDGVPEEFLLVQDLVQDDVQANWNVAYHRKFIVIDGSTSIIASLNIGNQYLYNTPLIAVPGNPRGVPAETNQWHDGCFRIRGDFAHLMERLFASQWMVLPGGGFYEYQNNFYNPSQGALGSDDCALFISFPGNPVNIIRHYFNNLIRFGDGDVIIENPYIIDGDFWTRLGTLSKTRSEQIRVCNPYSTNDHPLNQSAVKCNGWPAFRNGVRLYDYFANVVSAVPDLANEWRFSHWKIALDISTNCVFYGSYNLNNRSALHDFEACVLVKSPRVANYVQTLLGCDLDISRVLGEESFFEHPNLHISCYGEDLLDYFS